MDHHWIFNCSFSKFEINNIKNKAVGLHYLPNLLNNLMAKEVPSLCFYHYASDNTTQSLEQFSDKLNAVSKVVMIDMELTRLEPLIQVFPKAEVAILDGNRIHDFGGSLESWKNQLKTISLRKNWL